MSHVAAFVPRPTAYDRTQRTFHWAMAALIFVALGLGIYAAYLPAGTSPRRELLDIHKSIGMTVLVLLPLRFIYRQIVGEPPYRRPPGRWSHLAARTAHLALYALMIVMPVTGYVYSGAGGYSLPWFGLFSWPRLVPRDRRLSELGFDLHYWAAWLIGALVALHLLAVAWHVWIRRDEVLARMAPGRRTRDRLPAG